MSNSDFATIVRIPVRADGTAGEASLLVAQDCARLAGIDGLTRDTDGSLLAAINQLDAIVRVRLDGTIESIASGAPLQQPASLEVGSWNGGSAIFVSNFARVDASAGQPARPGVVIVDRGTAR